jgi:putative protease
MLRFGYEDEGRHYLYKVTTSVPKKGRLVIHLPPHSRPRSGTPVFLIDRRDAVLEKEMTVLEQALDRFNEPEIGLPRKGTGRRQDKRPSGGKPRKQRIEMTVCRGPSKRAAAGRQAYWLTPQTLSAVSKKEARDCWWWLPPVIWPDSEPDLIRCLDQVVGRGGRKFVLNAPWQTGLLPDVTGLRLWAGPFCNQANGEAISQLGRLGFEGVVVSPELSKTDLPDLVSQSRLPLGIVVSGMWPLCISRTIAPEMVLGRGFKSPKGEEAWVRQYGPDYWVFPNWKLDLEQHREMLIQAGFQLLVTLEEPVPKGIRLKQRPGLWNWNIELR